MLSDKYSANPCQSLSQWVTMIPEFGDKPPWYDACRHNPDVSANGKTSGFATARPPALTRQPLSPNGLAVTYYCTICR